jgi:hypothetical protein
LSSTILNLLLAGPLQQVLGVIKSTQILTHLLLINVATPASASIFFGQLMSLITLQLLDMTNTYTSVLQLPEGEAYTEQFNILGYNSMFVILNLGTVVLGMTIPIILYVIVSSVIKWLLPKYSTFKQKITDMLFFDKTFDFINETYILLAMCACLNLRELQWDSYGVIINSLVSVLLLAVTVIFPVFIANFYPRNFNKIYHRQKTIMNRFGSLVKDLAIFREGRKVFIYIWVSQLRKLTLVAMLVYM